MSSTTAATAQTLATGTAGVIPLANQAECQSFFIEGTGKYGHMGKMALATEFTKIATDLTTDDVDLTLSCAADGKLTFSPAIFVKKGLAKDGAAIKTLIDAVTVAEWKTKVKAACDSITAITTAATVSDASTDLAMAAAPVQVNGKYGKLDTTLSAVIKVKAECDAMIAAGATGQDYLAQCLEEASRTTFGTATTKQIEKAQVKFPGLAATCTANGAKGEVDIPFQVVQRRTDPTDLATAKTNIAAFVVGADKTCTGATPTECWWKFLDASTVVTTADGVDAAPVKKVAAAITTQTASQTVSGSTDITMKDAAECNSLKSSEVILVMKEKIKTLTGALYGDQALTFSCKAAVATMYLSITSATGDGGNTLAADVKTELEKITNWATTLKTEADKVLSTAVTVTGTPTVTWSAPTAVVTAQAKAAIITGNVVYGVHNRADCEDLVGKKADILTKLETAVGAQTTSTDGNMISITCLDKVPTLAYTIIVKKAATTIDQVIVNALNAMDDAAWKKIITDGLAVATAVTLEDASKLSVTTVNAPTSIELTTTTTTTGTKGTAAPYVPMSKVMGKYTVKSDESGCLNMKDQKAAIATVIKTESTVATAGTVTVEVKCAVDSGTTYIATIDYTIMMPTSSTPTGEAIVTALKGVSKTKWETDVAKAVGDVTGVPAPTLTAASWTSATDPAASVITTTKGPTTTYTGSTTLGTASTITGKLAVTVGSLAECQKMADANGKDALAKMIADETGADKSTVTVAVACARRRRLSDGRRLTATATATVDYTVQVAATSQVTASTMAAKLKAIDNTAWAGKVTTALANAGTAVTLTNVSVTKTDPTTTKIHNVSSAITGLVSPLVGLFAVLQFLF